MIIKRNLIAIFTFAMLCALCSTSFAAKGWVVYKGAKDGVGNGKHIVLISGDEEYRSEEALPQLGKILAKHHGFKCTVLFAINEKDGTIDPNNQKNIPGLEALKTADLMIIATRFRNLPDEQMKHFDDYVKACKPILGMRTATHAFRNRGSKKYAKYGGNKEWPGGFGKQILGETWVNHHGHHGRQSTRGVVAKGQEKHPIVKGCGDIWGPTDVYGVRLPLKNCKPLVMGQVLAGMKPSDKPVDGKKNSPMMPVAWTKTYSGEGDKKARVFTTTMGAATDLESVGVRRMLVNASYWCLSLEDKIQDKSKVDIVGEFKPTRFGFNAAKKGMKPSDFEMKE